MTTKEIAGSMKVGPNTVKTYLRLIMTKMRVTTRAGIIGKILAG
jgi:DNA-binding CsgD family transcriptional regulator